MMTALYIVLIVLSILGAYMAAILAVQSIMHKSFEGARSFVNELLKDVLYGRGSFALACSRFPSLVMNDIRAYLPNGEFEKWWNRFSMYSETMEVTGKSNGLPYYQVKLLLISEESKGVYENIIRTAAWDSLALANCTERRVYISWIPTNEADFQLCRVIYARTAIEIDQFSKLIEFEDSSIVSHDNSMAEDDELNSELKKYGDSNGE